MIFSENLLGLRDLFETNRFVRCEKDGKHTDLTPEHITEVFLPFIENRVGNKI